MPTSSRTASRRAVDDAAAVLNPRLPAGAVAGAQEGLTVVPQLPHHLAFQDPDELVFAGSCQRRRAGPVAVGQAQQVHAELVGGPPHRRASSADGPGRVCLNLGWGRRFHGRSGRFRYRSGHRAFSGRAATLKRMSMILTTFCPPRPLPQAVCDPDRRGRGWTVLEKSFPPMGFVGRRMQFGEVENLYARRGPPPPTSASPATPTSREVSCHPQAWGAPIRSRPRSRTNRVGRVVDMEGGTSPPGSLGFSTALGHLPGSLSFLITGDEGKGNWCWTAPRGGRVLSG